MNKRNTEDRVILQVFVTPKLKARIDRAAEKDGLSLAAFLRRLLTRKFRT